MNWVRISLPIVVLAAIAPPLLTTTYVALRAIFGLSRQITHQIARFVSVRYVQLLEGSHASADLLAARAILICAFINMGVATVAVVDHSRLLGIWLQKITPDTVNLVALSFAFGAAAYGYQVIAGVMIRLGQVERVAKRQYSYLLASLTAALLAYLIGSPTLYLVLLTLQDIFIGALFASALGSLVLRMSLVSITGALVGITGLYLLTRSDFDGLFTSVTPYAIAASSAAAIAAIFIIPIAGLMVRHSVLVKN